ncbi:MAG: hypothetical protein L6V95_03905 [Candidatus Melainabacteria bacterium]|nr:MAG: hypothetical protein L6V95_03905 [Candidatus Melainabacteria bacterium]
MQQLGKKKTNENNSSIDEIVTTIKNANKLAMADIATFEEAQTAYEKGGRYNFNNTKRIYH